MDKVAEKITKIVEDVLVEKQDLFLIELVCKGNVGNSKVVVILDGDNGIKIEDCSFVSRRIAEVLEAEDLIPGKYTLEVTSAGLEHPLKLLRQYKKNVGRNVRITLEDGGIKEGVLKAAQQDGIDLEYFKDIKNKEKDLIQIPFKSIKKTNVLVSFK